MTKFEGLEEYPHLLADPRVLCRDYLDSLNQFVTVLRRGCLKERIDYTQITTDQMLDVALAAFLATRLSTHKIGMRK